MYKKSNKFVFIFAASCQFFQDFTKRSTLANKIKSIDTSMLNQSDSILTKTLLYGDPRSNTSLNTQ